MFTRIHEAELLRNEVAVTLPGGSYIYIVQDKDTLERIVNDKLHTEDINQTIYYVNIIALDPRNFLTSAQQILYAGQIIYIPKRIA